MKPREEYGYLLEFWREEFHRDVTLCAVAFVLATLAGYAAGMLVPDFRDWVTQLMQQVLSNAGVDASGSLSFVALLTNNIFATWNICLMGLLPFVFLPAFALGVNAALLGVMAALYQLQGLSMGLYVASLLPHAIFELLALVLALAIALRLCQETTRICRKRALRPFGHVAADCLRVYALAVLPLLLVSAVVETYVTPQVVGLFFPS